MNERKYLFILLFAIIPAVQGAPIDNLNISTQYLVSTFVTEQCSDTSAVNYGSFEGCEYDDTQLNVNYLCSPTVITGWWGEKTGNTSLDAVAVKAFNAFPLYQADNGGFMAGNEYNGVRNPDSVFGSVCWTLAYDYVDDNINNTENNTFLAALERNVLYDVMNYTEIIVNERGGGPGIAASRLYAGRSVRKQIPIPKNIMDDTGKIYVSLRLGSVVGSPNVSQGNYLTSYVTNTSYPLDPYPLYRVNGAGDSGWIWIYLNDSYLTSCIDDGANYVCNFTVTGPDAWDSTNHYQALRIGPDSGSSWVSTDNESTWVAQSSTEYIFRLRYYNYSSSLNKLDDHEHLINQQIGKGTKCLLARNIFTVNSTMYNISDACYRYTAQNFVDEAQDGVFAERNAIFSQDPNAPDYGAYYSGYAPLYQGLNGYLLAILYNKTENSTYKTLLNDHVEFMYYHLLDEDLSRYAGYGTRHIGTKHTIMNDFQAYYWMASFAIGRVNNIYYNTILDKFNNYEANNPVTTNGLFPTHTIGFSALPLLYDNFPSVNNSLLLPAQNDTGRSIKYFNDTNVVIVHMPEFSAWISYGNNTPSGGVISGIYNRTHYRVTAGGATGAFINDWVGGIGTLTGDGSCYNVYDPQATLTVISDTYPFQLRFTGDMRNPDQTTCGYNYSTLYTFYDKEIIINQSTSGNAEMRTWFDGNQSIRLSITPQTSTVDKGIGIYSPQSMNFFDVDRTTDDFKQIEYLIQDYYYRQGTSFSYAYSLNPNSSSCYIPSGVSGSCESPYGVFVGVDVNYTSSDGTIFEADLQGTATSVFVGSDITINDLSYTRSGGQTCTADQIVFSGGYFLNLSTIHNYRSLFSSTNYVCSDDGVGIGGGSNSSGGGDNSPPDPDPEPQPDPDPEPQPQPDNDVFESLCGLEITKPKNFKGVYYLACPPDKERKTTIDLYNPSNEDKTLYIEYSLSQCYGPEKITVLSDLTNSFDVTCLCPESGSTINGYVQVTDNSADTVCLEKVPITAKGNKWAVLFLDPTLLFTIIGMLLAAIIIIAVVMRK